MWLKLQILGLKNLCNSIYNANSTIWHNILGYTSHIDLRAISKFFPCVSTKNTWCPYDSWNYHKQNKFSFPLSTSISHYPFYLLHGDLWGPFYAIYLLGHKYFLTFVDDFSRFTWIIFLKPKLRLEPTSSTLSYT